MSRYGKRRLDAGTCAKDLTLDGVSSDRPLDQAFRHYRANRNATREGATQQRLCRRPDKTPINCHQIQSSTVNHKMSRSGDGIPRKHSLKLAARLESLHVFSNARTLFSAGQAVCRVIQPDACGLWRDGR